MSDSRISIIGFGDVGKALFREFLKHDYKIISVFNRSKIDSELIHKHSEVEFYQGIPESPHILGDLIFLTVADDALSEVSYKLSAGFADFDNKYIVHCSGTHTSSILKACKEKGAKVASFHPIKAITSHTSSFKKNWFDIEGEEPVMKKLSEIAESFGAKSFQIEPESKPYLHASAVVASNYLVVLSELVSRILKAGNIPEAEAMQALMPLMENTLHNIQDLGPENALTGPIERGDVNTVKEHLELLKNTPDLISLYKKLGIEAVSLAMQKHGNTPALKEIKALLS